MSEAHPQQPARTQSQPIRFFHRGAIVEVSGVHPTRTVLDWLREDAHCTGTKEGCNEGDCGACTVVIGDLASGAADGGLAAAASTGGAGAALRLRTVNACIQYVPTLHGKALFTVEDLKAQAAIGSGGGSGSALHPVQQAMVDCHGSQCGFCTPGFVMSLWSLYQRRQAVPAERRVARPTRQQLADELSGNLCRCTGYRPILDAGQRMFELPPVLLDEAPVVAALASMSADAGDATFGYAAPNPQVPVDGGSDGNDNGGNNGRPRTDRFDAPRTLAALAALREAHPQATLLAGCTDIGLWTNKQFRDLRDIIYVGDVAELKVVEQRAGDDAGGELFIGAGASLEAAFGALAQRAPALTDVWLRFASPPIRNAGTMGGSVANGSPIGDSAPVLMALDAQIELRRGDRVRRLPLADFYVGYMKNRLEPGEFVAGLAVPLAAFRRQLRAYKISKRFDCDISALCAGLAIGLDGNGAVEAVRIAFGGMAATVQRAAGAEAALAGRPWTQASVDDAKAALASDFKPLSDMRASAGYRLRVAQNLLQRFWLETRAAEPLSAHDTSVWSVMPHDAAAASATIAEVAPKRIDLHGV